MAPPESSTHRDPRLRIAFTVLHVVMPVCYPPALSRMPSAKRTPCRTADAGRRCTRPASRPASLLTRDPGSGGTSSGTRSWRVSGCASARRVFARSSSSTARAREDAGRRAASECPGTFPLSRPPAPAQGPGRCFARWRSGGRTATAVYRPSRPFATPSRATSGAVAASRSVPGWVGRWTCKGGQRIRVSRSNPSQVDKPPQLAAQKIAAPSRRHRRRGTREGRRSAGRCMGSIRLCGALHSRINFRRRLALRSVRGSRDRAPLAREAERRRPSALREAPGRGPLHRLRRALAVRARVLLYPPGRGAPRRCPLHDDPVHSLS